MDIFSQNKPLISRGGCNEVKCQAKIRLGSSKVLLPDPQIYGSHVEIDHTHQVRALCCLVQGTESLIFEF